MHSCMLLFLTAYPCACISGHTAGIRRRSETPKNASTPTNRASSPLRRSSYPAAAHVGAIHTLESVEHEMEEEDKIGHHHPLVMLTKTHEGTIAKLHTVGKSLDHNLMLTDATGILKAGVGIRLQQESRWGIYVAELTPNGPADSSGKIKEDDVLIQIDGYEIQAHDTLETVRQRVLGPPGSTVSMMFERQPSGRLQQLEHFSVSLVRATAGRSDAEQLLQEAYKEIQNLRETLEGKDESFLFHKRESARVQRSAAPAPPPIISPAALADIKQDLEQAKALCTDLRLANDSLVGEIRLVQQERAQLVMQHSKELEEHRRQVRELKEQQIQLASSHAKELHSKNASLHEAQDEAEQMKMKMRSLEQIEATCAALRKEQSMLEVQKHELQKETADLQAELRRHKEHTNAREIEWHSQLNMALEKERLTVLALDQATARIAGEVWDRREDGQKVRGEEDVSAELNSGGRLRHKERTRARQNMCMMVMW